MNREPDSKTEDIRKHGGAATELPDGCLLVVSDAPGVDRGRSYRLTRGRVRVGTSKLCELILTDKSVSREHVELALVTDGIMVRDLGSTNGTLYLDQRIDGVVLRPGARITVGRCTIDILPLDSQANVPPSTRDHYDDLVGNSLAMRRLYTMLERLEGSDTPVLISGETGTGKELVANAIHAHSDRAGAPFVVVDCGNVQKELISSTLFGHVRGAFTDAVSDRRGAFEEAHTGTVLLDEIGELPIDLQPQLLRVLENHEVVPLGSNQPREVDVRVLAATHRDLARQVGEGAFREDLYYRLAVIEIQTPPLRDRRDDIPLLIDHLAHQLDDSDRDLPESAVNFMVHYDWPGNVRQLRNAVHRLLVLGTLDLDQDAVTRPPTPSTDMAFRDAKDVAIREFETAYLRDLLERAGGNLSAAARMADVDRKHLRRLLKRYGLYRG
jgi:DNA-binding NtrC family response regulator